MMFFSRKKKIQRDRNAGLVFRWRGGYAGNTGGLTLAIILATSIFALGMLGIKVYVSSASPPSRYRAEITRVMNIDPSLRWHLERNSPYLSSWNKSQNVQDVSDVRHKMYAAIDATREDQLHWNTVEFTERSLEVPRVFKAGKVAMPNLARPALAEPGAANDTVVEWFFLLSTPDEKARNRLPIQTEYATDARSLADYQGKTLKYTVNVNARGEVVSAVPLEWNTDAESKLIENWLNTVQFKALKEGEDIESLIISVNLSGRRVAK